MQYIPSEFEHNTSSKLLLSQNHVKLREIINNEPITLEDIEKFLGNSPSRTFGLIFKINQEFYTFIHSIDEDGTFMCSNSNKVLSKDKFERWSRMIYGEREAQIDEEGNFI